eukprot:gene15746-21868_t
MVPQRLLPSVLHAANFGCRSGTLGAVSGSGSGAGAGAGSGAGAGAGAGAGSSILHTANFGRQSVKGLRVLFLFLGLGLELVLVLVLVQVLGRLSFTQQTLGINLDIISRMPSEESPLDAVDFTKKTWPIYADGAEKHLEDVLAFCRSVATFQARTWKDAFPLVDLLRGLLLYMIDQTMKGQKIFEERARRNHAEALKAESERMAAEYAARLEEEKRLWQLQLEERIAATMVETRARVSEEMARDINEMKSEIEQWTTKCAVAELHAKKLHDQIAGLQRQIEAFQTQIEVDKAAHSRALNDKGNEIRSLDTLTNTRKDALSNTRKVISDALKAKTKKEIMDVATAAITATLPGSNAYVAELRSVGALSPTQAQTALAEVQQLALADPTSIFGQGLKALGMEFLTSPAVNQVHSETAARCPPHPLSSAALPTSAAVEQS